MFDWKNALASLPLWLSIKDFLNNYPGVWLVATAMVIAGITSQLSSPFCPEFALLCASRRVSA